MLLSEKTRKIVRFGAWGNGDLIDSRLPKYGRNAPRLKAAKSLHIEVVFATYFIPSDTRKCC
jgi:hypothetical protein